MENILRSELYPLREPTFEHKSLVEPSIPKLNGEYYDYIGSTLEGKLCLSVYRLCHQDNNGNASSSSTFFNIPLGLIDNVEIKDVLWLHIVCKDVTSVKCAFTSAETCQEWLKRLQRALAPPCETKYFFAFAFYAHFMDHPTDEVAERLGHEPYPPYSYRDTFQSEWERMKFDESPVRWRQCSANQNYELCETYPKYVIVPSGIDDTLLKSSADFRSNQRFPVVVWRHQKNGAVIARSSQPQVGMLGWRKKEDEMLLEQITKACAGPSGAAGCHEQGSKKLLIMDARSYTAAYSNRIRSGGYEFVEYYPFSEMSWMRLVNIHDVRACFQALQLCSQATSNTSWWKAVDGTSWLQNMHLLLVSAVNLAATIELEARPVLVHCSDGWDRTPQLVALAEILLDPYYRTVKGFQVLVEREWLEFGHKFDDRCGRNEKTSERSPVFLQWLDCVYQLLVQFPTEFQFNSMFLVKLAQHTYATLFGTFLCNSSKDREDKMVAGQTFSVWKFLNHSSYRNHLYNEANCERVLWASSNVCDLVLWKDLYLATSSSNSYDSNDGGGTCTPPVGGETGFTSLNGNDRLSFSSVESCDGSLTNNRSDSCYTSGQTGGGVNASLTNGSEVGVVNTTSLTASSPPPPAYCNGVQSPSCCSSSSSSSTSSSLCKQLVNGHSLPVSSVDSLTDLDSTDGLSTGGSHVTSQTSSSARTSGGIAIKSRGSRGVDASTDTLIAGASSYGSSCNSHTFVFPDTTPEPVPNVASSCPPPPPGGRTHPRSSPHVAARRRVAVSQFDPVDGLTVLRDEVCSRIETLVSEHRSREMELEREVYSLRMKLLELHTDSGVGLNNNNNHVNGNGTNGCVNGGASNGRENGGDKPEDEGSVCSTEVSWESGEEREAQPTLWIPDHAVTRCMSCDSQFWLGRRKHHCRSCGKIFCADCSENVVALPCEQLYEPVRVCTTCYQTSPQAGTGASVAQPCTTPSTLTESISSSLSSNATLSNSVSNFSSPSHAHNGVNGLCKPVPASPTVAIVSNLKSVESCKQAAAAGEEHSQSAILSHHHRHQPPTSTS
uniref:Lateral signaling target protein 2 homolog n=1 Tax=Cacopsylla melanoneura TaxID=428564 RepID=A0A8D9BHH3_9HEMI